MGACGGATPARRRRRGNAAARVGSAPSRERPMSASIRSMFGRLPPVARRDERITKLDRRIAKLNRRVDELGEENARLEQQLASGELLTRPSFRARVHEGRRLRALEVEMRVPS